MSVMYSTRGSMCFSRSTGSLRSRLSPSQQAWGEWTRQLASEADRRHAQASDPTQQISFHRNTSVLIVTLHPGLHLHAWKWLQAWFSKLFASPVAFNHLAQRHFLLYLSKMIKGLGEWLYQDRLGKLHIYNSTEWQPRGRYCTICWAQIMEDTLSCFHSNSIAEISNLEKVFQEWYHLC